MQEYFVVVNCYDAGIGFVQRLNFPLLGFEKREKDLLWESFLRVYSEFKLKKG